MSREKIEICDRCGEKFARKWNRAGNHWSQINDILYWTDGQEINSKLKIVCRACLKEIHLRTDELIFLMNEKKRKSLGSYANMGVLDKDDKTFSS